MRITEVSIRNFRGIKSLDLDLGPIAVLIGENNSGKTSVLDALKLCLRDFGPRRRAVFNALDHHLPDGRAEPSSADPIEIEVAFSDGPDDEWDDGLIGRLNRVRVLQMDEDGRNHVRLRVTSRYDRSSGEFVHNSEFLDPEGDKLSRVPARAITVLQDEIRYFYLRALRGLRYWRSKNPRPTCILRRRASCGNSCGDSAGRS